MRIRKAVLVIHGFAGGMYDEDNNKIEVVNHPRQIVKIRISEKLNKYDLMRIKVIDKIENI